MPRRRPAQDLAIQTRPVSTSAPVTIQNDEFELTQSPASSVSHLPSQAVVSGSTIHVPSEHGEHALAYTPPKPSVKNLYSLLSRRDLVLFVLPAIATSVIAGGIAPFMTLTVGQSFDAFADFPLSDPSKAAKDRLLHRVGIAAFQLLGLGLGALVLTCVTSALWVSTGERNVMALRKRVYAAVTRKDMAWFDTNMGSENATEGEGALGAGGLMAKFARETDDVRQATSLSSGFLIQYLTTCITCLALGFVRSWSLTLVILSAVPLLMIIQVVSQSLVAGPLAQERNQAAAASTRIDRALNAIATVKAFTAGSHESSKLGVLLDGISRAARRCNAVWALSSGMSQFTMYAMFVQGFWFGAHLVRRGELSAGDVMAVFWACLIATTNLQLCIPQLITLAKGKFAMVALLTLVEEPSSSSAPADLTAVAGSTGMLHKKSQRVVQQRLKRITPDACKGELNIADVTFAYPSRPSAPVLQDLSLYFPAGETTFIVGGSGSGKSTVAQLLLRLYAPHHGSITIDDQDVAYLNQDWLDQHVAAVSQQPVLFDMSLRENVAMGAGEGKTPSQEEIEEACRVALLDEFVNTLPEGYDTRLGNSGANLSGGQKQRLAIARARLRDPTILILDEATSALDATSRILVFEAIKRWRSLPDRRPRTTIVITHDLSQIAPADFAFVLKDGVLVEQGFRADLEMAEGEFAALLRSQNMTGGFVPVSDEDVSASSTPDREQPTVRPMQADVEAGNVDDEDEEVAGHPGHKSRPITMSNWMFDVIADLTSARSPTPAPGQEQEATTTQPETGFIPLDAFATEMTGAPYRRLRRPSSAYFPDGLASPGLSRRYSLQFSPTSSHFPGSPRTFSDSSTLCVDLVQPVSKEEEQSFAYSSDAEKAMLERGAWASRKRLDSRPNAEGTIQRTRSHRDEKSSVVELSEVKVKVEQPSEQSASQPQARLGFWRLLITIFPTIPHKSLVFVGLMLCVISGAMTPVFSFLLSKLMVEVSNGARDMSEINIFGGICLAIAAVDGLAMGLKFLVMEGTAVCWITNLRKQCFERVLKQDKKWFDKSENSPVRLVQVLIKDGDDARNLIAVVVGQFLVVVAMLGVGLIWALVRGWQLTLVGFAVAPVFMITMSIQARLMSNTEIRNKRAREEIAKIYYDSISNIRAIRSMAFGSILQKQFDSAAANALSTGIKGSFIEGASFGMANALIYLAEALLFYAGAIFMAKGTYTYLQMVQTLNLVVFSVSIGSQLMAFTNRIAKSTEATRDFNRLHQLSTQTDESRGVSRPPVMGTVAFDDVHFSYPERPDVPVLSGLSMQIRDNECVAIVGASGSGKSTVAALLQRLYEPGSGIVRIGPNDLRAMDVTHLREHVSVVSQNPHLFDASIAENIAYGNPSLTEADIRRAAKAASVHDFIISLPQGYDTPVGENAALISGGQAQRIQIARALARPCKILILDECTSALDTANQRAVMRTIRQAKVGRTTLVVTHKLPVMQMCDRILVVQDGKIAEEGTFDALLQKHGVFAQLASGGEWDA